MNNIYEPLEIFFDSSIDGYNLEKAQIIKCFKPLTIRKKNKPLQYGDVWDTFYFISSGLFRLVYTTKDGKEFNKGFFTTGQLMGPIAPIIQEKPSDFYIEALEDCSVLFINAHKFRHKLKGNVFGETIQKILAEELASIKVKREADFLLNNAETRYLNFINSAPDLNKRLTNLQIASYIGITEVSLSRIRKKLSLKPPNT